MQPRDIEKYLHEKIPLTKAMKVKVETYEADRLVLTAPLSANYNHLGTAFGGSLNTLAILAGYALLWLELGDASAHVVIRESSVRFRRPVRGELRAVCRRPSDEVLDAFREKYSKEHKARITLQAVLEENGETAVEFEGVYVAVQGAA